nr:GDSL esterase/lipase At5g03820-like [Ipomoea batatas]
MELDAMVERMTLSQFHTIDLTDNDLVKDHLRHLIGGRSSVQDELLCRFVFPERPGALMKFLDAFSPRWNISLFHYRSQGEAGANVLVGLQVASNEIDEFKQRANNLGYEYAVETCTGAKAPSTTMNYVSCMLFRLYQVPSTRISAISALLNPPPSKKKKERKMGFSRSVWGVFVAAAVFAYEAKGDPMVPSLCIFGDSVVDSGNNNNLNTVIKANFPPYGRDFVNHQPTGRFCNGKLATDFIAEYLGFTSYPPAYLSQEANGNSILAGANFASAASGYYDSTPQLYRAITLQQQLGYYKEWQSKVASLAGKAKANNIISGGIHLVSAGTSDFIQNYYVNPMVCRAYTPDQFSDLLMQSYTTFIQVTYLISVIIYVE